MSISTIVDLGARFGGAGNPLTPDPGGEPLPFTINGTPIWYQTIAQIAAAHGGTVPLLGTNAGTDTLNGTLFKATNNPSAVGASSPPTVHNAVVDNLLYQAYTNFGTIGYNDSGQYTPPRYVVNSAVEYPGGPSTWPVVQVNPPGWSQYSPGRATGTCRFPMPSWAKTAGAGDSEFVLYDTATSTMFEGWQLWDPAVGFEGQWTSETIVVYNTTTGNNSTGVATTGATSSYCTPTNLSNTATECGMAHGAGDIKALEYQAGVPQHALLIGTPGVFSAPYKFAPANYCTDGGTTISGYPIPMGTRFYLPASVSEPGPVAANPLSHFFFQALQTYGAYVCDSSGAVGYSLENSLAWTAAGLADPWAGFTGYEINLQGASFMPSDFPWTSLQAMSPSVFA